MPDRIPITYTFGNHMHWVDMQWLWGYHVLPGSVRDMLKYCRETGAKGNLNFDGVGLEKMAAEAPEALAELKQAVQDGIIEPVGCSYGQPYGLFHGGESNIRQRIYGARTVRRLLGVWPKTFWEEEFDFFPQLPQILRGVGFEFASLYFQWTWHTPEVPREIDPVVWWEGVDGSQLKCASRNALNLHQWPEDFQILLNDLASGTVNVKGENPLILQWLELMPSPDWMCRSELMIPKLLELKRDLRFDVSFATLGEYLAKAPDSVPVRKYGMGDVWHGMSLGKNGDNMRMKSAEAETLIMTAEAMASVVSLMGRPYAQWDVYPVWELEEAWRELLQAQHHDNDECEGLCGRVGKASYEKAAELARGVILQQSALLDRVLQGEWIFSPCGFDRPSKWNTGEPIAPFAIYERKWGQRPPHFEQTSGRLTYKGPDYSLEINTEVGKIASFASKWHPNGIFDFEAGTLELSWRSNGKDRIFQGQFGTLSDEINTAFLCNSTIEWKDEHKESLMWRIGPALDATGLELSLCLPNEPPDPGMNAGLKMRFVPKFEVAEVFADTPFAVQPIEPYPCGLRKYPQGDWMTSPQWFEDVENSFTSNSFVDLCDSTGAGVLLAHKGTKCWFMNDTGVQVLLTMKDPWDEEFYDAMCLSEFNIVPHGPWTNRERWQAAAQFRGHEMITENLHGKRSGESFEPIKIKSSSTAITAFYRESEDFSGANVEHYAGTGMGYPFVLRLVELNGESDEVELYVFGEVAKAYRTNLLGQIENEIVLNPNGGRTILRLTLKPREIATVYLDIVEGRKQSRNLDEHREVWATVHRVTD